MWERGKKKIKNKSARREAKARGDATWHGWSGRVVWGLSTTRAKSKEFLSLLPCQSVTPSYDPGESVFVCVFLSLPLLSLSTWQHQQTTTAISFSLSIYSFVCPLSLSPRISHLLLASIHALIPFSAYPLSPFFHSSHAIPLPASIWSIAHAGMLVNFPPSPLPLRF